MHGQPHIKLSYITTIAKWISLCSILLELESIIMVERENKPESHRHKGFLSSTRGADKSLVWPGRKQATANKLGIYSTYSPQNSINVLARCSNFCKPLKKIQRVVRLTKCPRQQWPQRRTKNGDLSIVFQSREQVVVRRGQIRKWGGWSRHWKPR